MSNIEKDNSRTINDSVYAAITMAVAFSILLILSGIWNAQKTAEIAESNIKTSLEAQQLSNSLRTHQDTMSSAIEFAVTRGEAQWRTNYENSLTKVREVMHTSSSLLTSDPIFDAITLKFDNIVQLERNLFNMVSEGNIDQAFSLLTSNNYQEQKIEQEQLALTLRAILDRKSKDVIRTLNERLNQTTFALILQIILIVAIWFYIVAVVRRWQRSQSQHSSELTRLAHYDTLTGIGNRALFQLRLESAFKQAIDNNKSVGLLLMDIDHFKDINDTLGHDVGDDLLIKVAEEVKRTCRESDTVVRLGGDEFAVIVTDLDEKRDTSILGNKILSIFEHHLLVKRHEIKTGTSIGFAFYPSDANTGDELLRKADMALYEAKRNGRGNFKFFDKTIETNARKKAEIQDDLRVALAEEQFELYYQPIIDFSQDAIIGVECLLRWNHPTKGLVPPDDFISIAEESRLIVSMGEWVLRTACKQQVAWISKGLPPLDMAVNLSGVQFNENKLLDVVENIIRETQITRNKLTLEITESTLMETGFDVVAKLHALNGLGLKLAIDDFGTGYSSLAYLKRFPIHHLKIDREFIKDIPNNTHDIAISRSIIKMAHELDIKVVAEGIEEKAQFKFLSDAACNYGQGYYFGKPMPAKELENRLLFTDESFSNVSDIKSANVTTIKK